MLFKKKKKKKKYAQIGSGSGTINFFLFCLFVLFCFFLFFFFFVCVCVIKRANLYNKARFIKNRMLTTTYGRLSNITKFDLTLTKISIQLIHNHIQIQILQSDNRSQTQFPIYIISLFLLELKKTIKSQYYKRLGLLIFLNQIGLVLQTFQFS